MSEYRTKTRNMQSYSVTVMALTRGIINGVPTRIEYYRWMARQPDCSRKDSGKEVEVLKDSIYGPLKHVSCI